jgi:hypothetical protein
MFKFSSLKAYPIETKNMQICGERSTAFYIKKPSLSIQILVFLASICVLSLIAYPQAAQTQEIKDAEISNMENRFRAIETQLVSIDNELKLLNQNLNTVTNDINRLKEEATSKGFLSNITGIFRRRRLSSRYTESQALADDIGELSKRRESLVNQIVTVSDILLDKAGSRMKELMATVRKANKNNDFASRDEAWKQLSYLWQLTEKTVEARNRHSPPTPGTERPIIYPSSLSNDPEELRLGAAIWRGEASSARTFATKLAKQIGDMGERKSVLEQAIEVSKEMQRRDEERGAIGVGVGTTHIPWGSDAASKKKIQDIEEEMRKLSIQKKEYEARAERFESQSRILEHRASQMDSNP